MGGNKYLTPDETSLFQTKLDVLTKRLQTSTKGGEFSSEEEFVAEATRAIRSFYRYLNSPFFDPRALSADDDPNAADYNEMWNVLIDDLVVIFTELENVETTIMENFNEAVTNANRLGSRIKTIASKLADYVLFSNNPDEGIVYFKETFTNLARVDTSSDLLNAAECFVNQDEGVITLPIDTNANSRINVTKPTIINTVSNGTSGNNEEVGADWNGEISLILDDNPDTWFEYERVTTKANDDGTALILDLTINIGAVKTLNLIKINPYDFDQEVVVELETLEVSKDGNIYDDIKQEIGSIGLTPEEERGVFSLGATAGKNTGEGIYTFLPKQAKYVHVVLKQSLPYPITTSDGEKMRYAIGIRDIELRSFAYLPAGELVSTKLETVRSVRRVLLEANQSPTTNSDLVEVHYLVSPDDGTTWHEIVPKHVSVDANDETSPPQVLIFNTSDTDSIKVSSDVSSLRVKTVLKRNNNAFVASSSSFKKATKRVSELHSIPEGEPFDITLGSAPVDGSVYVIDPAYGSRGLDDFKYVLINGKDQTSDKKTVKLPFADIPRPTRKNTTTISGYNSYYTAPVDISNFMKVYVGGQEWPHATQPLDSYSGGADKVYMYDSVSGVLRFGDDSNSASPFSADSIAIMFSKENLFPTNDKNAHRADLVFPTSYSKSRFDIEYFDTSKEGIAIARSGSTEVDLGHTHISKTTDIETVMSGLGYTTKRIFSNGRDELRSSADWSIDTVKGKVYTREPLPSNADITLPFTYTPVVKLENKDFDFISSDGNIANSIVIRDSGWFTTEIEDEETRAGSGVNIVELEHQAVVPGTLTISVTAASPAITDSNNPFIKEVPFVDGRSELGSSISLTREQIASLTPTANVATFTLNENISTDTAHKVSFSNTTLFSTEVSTTPAAAGEYAIDYSGGNRGRVRVYTTSAVSTPGYVSYFYVDLTYKDSGLYSVDYNGGRIYMQRRFPTSNDWVISADYQCTNYKASYRIARLLNPQEYTVDVKNRTITFDESEVLTREAISQDSTKTGFYTVNYDTIVSTTVNPETLKRFYSPVVRNYALKILLNEND